MDTGAQRRINFDDELYDDAGSETTILTPIIEFLKDKMIYVGIVGVALVAIIIAIIVLDPFGGVTPAIDPVIEEEEEIAPLPQLQTVRIPDFRNQTLIDLLTDTRFNDVFTFVHTNAYDDNVPEGDVISQTPEPGVDESLSPLGDRIRINLIISDGPEPSPLDDITGIEVRYGPNALPGRAQNNPGLTLRLERDPTIILTCRIEAPSDFSLEELLEEVGEDYEFIEWISANEDIFIVTSVNNADNTARIQAMGTGSAQLIVRLGEHEDRVIVTVVG
jgi:hypothetical protein